MELLRCELLANPAAVADVHCSVVVLSVHKTPSCALSRKEGMGQNSSYTPAVSLFRDMVKVACRDRSGTAGAGDQSREISKGYYERT